MKKFLFFFSTLFFLLIPNVSASAPPNPYLLLDFRNESATPILPDSISYLTDTKCPFNSCGDITYYEALNNLINSLNDNGYYFYIKLNRNGSNFGDYYFNIGVIDTKKTDITKMFVKADTYSSHNDIIYNLRNEEGSFYRWSFVYMTNSSSFPTIDDILNSINSTSSSSTTYDNFLTWDGSDTSNYLIGNTFPFYANFDWSFDLTLYQSTLVSDYYSLYTTDDLLGPVFNKDFYLWSYINGNGYQPPEEDEPDNPNQGIEDGLGNINDSINNSDISGAQGGFNNFFNDFKDNNYGLSDIITMPLTFIKGLSTNACTPIALPIPFVDQTAYLPCISSIFEKHFSPLLSAYQLITFGIISYFIIINIFKTVRGFKNPDSNNVEVLEL